MRVLVVEDEPEVADLLVRTLHRATWSPDVAATGARALELLAVNDYDLAVLDLMLPDLDGLEVCRRWRVLGGRTPILMLTARSGLGDRVAGLDAGADDYLAKPFAAEELMARLRALARRPPTEPAVVLRFRDLTLDPRTLVAGRAGMTLGLTSRELALLEYLLRHPGTVLSRGEILNHVWDDNFDPVGNVVDVLIGRLRRKLEEAGGTPLIHTVRGRGYVLTDPPPDAR